MGYDVFLHIISFNWFMVIDNVCFVGCKLSRAINHEKKSTLQVDFFFIMFESFSMELTQQT